MLIKGLLVVLRRASPKAYPWGTAHQWWSCVRTRIRCAVASSLPSMHNCSNGEGTGHMPRMGDGRLTLSAASVHTVALQACRNRPFILSSASMPQMSWASSTANERMGTVVSIAAMKCVERFVCCHYAGNNFISRTLFLVEFTSGAYISKARVVHFFN